MVVQARTRFYREFLTPALHRRFTRAAAVTFLVCYIEAVLLGDKSSLLWSWFPLGRAGLRTLLLFISSLSIFVLRVAQLHFGARMTASPFETFRQFFFRFNTVQTWAWYFFSAWWFGEVYIWSASYRANLHWVAEGKSYERLRLNERPIYLRSVFCMLAIVQSFLHIYYDYDEVILPTQKIRNPTSIKDPHRAISPLMQLRKTIPSLWQGAVARTCATSLLGPVFYAVFIRRTAWTWTLYFARLVWDVPRASEPARIPPYHISLILRSATSGFLLITLWELSNAVFTSYVSQEPLKGGNPLTDDSGDPNGSLLNGLKAKKELSKKFAFWELRYISSLSLIRRKSIFSDIDRAGGPMWTQVMIACLGMIQGISGRIAEFQNPQLIASLSAQQQQQPTVQGLPRMSAPLRQEPVVTNPLPPKNRRERIESNIGTVAKSYGQSSPSREPMLSLSPRAKRYLGTARDKLLTQDQQKIISPASLTSTFNDYLMQFLRSQLGVPFRQTFRRRVCAVVLGTPYSDLVPIIHAVESLTLLAVSSLEEDSYGTVNKDIPLLIRTFVSTMNSIESFVQGLPPHWTDVDFDDSVGGAAGRSVDEVGLIMDSLKEGVRRLVETFGEYALDLGLGQGELRVARQVAGLVDR